VIRLHITSEGTIEKEGEGMLQVLYLVSSVKSRDGIRYVYSKGMVLTIGGTFLQNQSILT
jgi:hypothetical protein